MTIWYKSTNLTSMVMYNIEKEKINLCLQIWKNQILKWKARILGFQEEKVAAALFLLQPSCDDVFRRQKKGFGESANLDNGGVV